MAYLFDFMKLIHKPQTTPSFYNSQLKHFLIKPPHLKRMSQTLISLESN